MTNYVPSRGDVTWMDFDPQLCREQAGRRPALILSQKEYNETIGLLVCCPITSRLKGYPFEVAIPPGLSVHGGVLSDHIKSLDWRRRNPLFFCQMPESVIIAVLAKFHSVIESELT
jgi:mRNA interferase MazF